MVVLHWRENKGGKFVKHYFMYLIAVKGLIRRTAQGIVQIKLTDDALQPNLCQAENIVLPSSTPEQRHA